MANTRETPARGGQDRPRPAGQGQPGDQGVVGAVTDKTKEVASAVGDYAGEAKDKAKEMATAVGDYAGEAKAKVQEWGGAAADRAGDALQDVGREVTTLIRRYPVQSVLVGVAVGFLIAQAARRS